MTVHDTTADLEKILHNGFSVLMGIELGNIYSIKFYRIQLTDIFDTEKIMVPYRMKIINGNLVSSLSKIGKDDVEIFIIANGFRFDYL